MGGRLATLDIGRKVGAAVSISVGGKLGLHLTKCGLGQGLPPYQVASWPIQPLRHNRYKARIIRTQTKPAPVNCESGGYSAPFRGGAVSPSYTMWPRPRRTSIPLGILIHPTVWPQYTNVIDRTDKTGHDRQATVRQDRANSFTNGRPVRTAKWLTMWRRYVE